MGRTTMLDRLDSETRMCCWIYRFGTNRGEPWGGPCRPPRSWSLGRRSGRVPALPYPPPRPREYSSEHVEEATGWSASLRPAVAPGPRPACSSARSRSGPRDWPVCPRGVKNVTATNGTRTRINVLLINDLRSTLTSIRFIELYINNIE